MCKAYLYPPKKAMVPTFISHDRYNDFSEAELTVKRIKYMRSCAKLAADPPMRLESPPSLQLVNRPHKGSVLVLFLCTREG